MNEVPTVIKYANSISLLQSVFIGFGFSTPPRSAKIEILAKIANGFHTLSRLLFLQKAQSKMLVDFLNLPFFNESFVTQKPLYILGSSKSAPGCEEIII